MIQNEQTVHCLCFFLFFYRTVLYRKFRSVWSGYCNIGSFTCGDIDLFVQKKYSAEKDGAM